MDKSRIFSAILALAVLAAVAAGARMPAAYAADHGGGGGSAAPKADDKTAKDKLRELFGGEVVEFLSLPLFSIPVIRDGVVTDQVNIAIALETRGEKNRDQVLGQRQKLYDAFLRDLYGLLAIKRADGQLFDPQVVKIRLMRVSDKLLGQGVVGNILVRGISQRPLASPDS